MNFQAISTEITQDVFFITLNRIEQQNSMNRLLIDELLKGLDIASNDKKIKSIVIQGKSGFFCTGMDFAEVTQESESKSMSSIAGGTYMSLLKFISSCPKIVIALIDGKVLAGGVGIAAACDIAIASPHSEFRLSEAMWGLLPANLMPYLIRRVGFQPAYFMTLSLNSISAQKAYEIGLIDEVSDSLNESLRKLMLNFRRLSDSTILEAKSFFRKMWIIDDEMEHIAINKLNELMGKQEILENIKNYIVHGKFPWESKE